VRFKIAADGITLPFCRRSSSDFCKSCNKTTIGPNHVYGALEELEFKEFKETLEKALQGSLLDFTVRSLFPSFLTCLAASEYKETHVKKPSKKKTDAKKEEEKKEGEEVQQPSCILFGFVNRTHSQSVFQDEGEEGDEMDEDDATASGKNNTDVDL
jgi:hypothetical protein